jgi:hypothetical protein
MRARRDFRPRRTLPAIITSALLLVAALLVATEVISAGFGHPMHLLPYEQVSRWAARTAWRDPWALLSSSVVTLAGLVLLCVALLPGRQRMVPLRTGDPDLVAGLSRRSLAAMLARAALRVDGVRDARAKLRRRRVTVTATTAMRDLPALSERVYDAVTAELDGLSPVRPLRVRARVRGPA